MSKKKPKSSQNLEAAGLDLIGQENKDLDQPDRKAEFEKTKSDVLGTDGSPDEPVKKKRTRRSKKEVEPQIELTTQHVQPVMQLVSGYFGKRLGTDWEFTVDEMEFGTKAFTELANKYAPILAKYGAEMNCGIFVGMYLIARWDLIKARQVESDLKAKKEENETEKRAGERKEYEESMTE